MATYKISSEKPRQVERIGLRRIMRDGDFSVIVNNGDGSFTIEAETVPESLPGQITVEEVEQIPALDGVRDAVIAAVVTPVEEAVDLVNPVTIEP